MRNRHGVRGVDGQGDIIDGLVGICWRYLKVPKPLKMKGIIAVLLSVSILMTVLMYSHIIKHIHVRKSRMPRAVGLNGQPRRIGRLRGGEARREFSQGIRAESAPLVEPETNITLTNPNRTLPRTLNKIQLLNITENPNCSEYIMTFDHIVHVNFYNASNPSTEYKISLVTQTSDSRLYMLKIISNYWLGPISAVIYVNRTNFQQITKETGSWLASTRRTDIRIHFMISEGIYYPINKLRNVAQNHSFARHILQIDIDFIPNKSLLDLIGAYIDGGMFSSATKVALVIPAMEMDQNATFPEDKMQLKELWNQNGIRLYGLGKGGFREGHQGTDFNKWMNTSDTYQIAFYPTFEPYVVLRRNDTPAYDERYVERYFDKAEHLMQVDLLGFAFWVMPQGYIVHQYHTRQREHDVVSTRIFKCAKYLWWKNALETGDKRRRYYRQSRHYRQHFYPRLYVVDSNSTQTRNVAVYRTKSGKRVIKKRVLRRRKRLWH